MEEVKRDRARRKLLRVTFPNGKVLCYKSTTDTMIATMQGLVSQHTIKLGHKVPAIKCNK